MGASLEEQTLDAVQRGDLTALRTALAKHPDMSSRPISAALSAAMAKSNDSFAKALVEGGANPTDTTEGGQSWYRAIAARNLDLVDWLLSRGVLSTPHSTADGGPINVAVGSFWPEGIKRLLAAGAAPDIADPDGNTPLLRLAGRPDWEAWRDDDYASVGNALITAGADPHHMNRQHLSAADLAWRSASEALLKVVDVDGRYRDRYSEIHQRNLDQQLRAAVRRHLNSRIRWVGSPPVPPVDLKAKISELVAQGASPHALPPNPTREFTAFEFALGADAFGGDPDLAVVQSLLTKPVATANARISPLVIAARKPELIRVLLAAGVSVEARFPLAQLALMQQRSRGQIANPGDVEIGVLHGAAVIGVPQTIEMIVRAGARCDDIATDGRTPLHLAITEQRLENADTLVRLGADPRLKNSTGRDAVDLAAESFAISLLRKIDREGRYRALLEEFPISPNPPRVGIWRAEGASGAAAMASLELRPDGGGVFNGRELGWSDQGDSVIFKSAPIFVIPGRTIPPMVWSAEVEPAGDSLRVTSPGAGTVRLFRNTTAVPAPEFAGPSQLEIQRAQSRVLEHAGAQVVGPDVTSLPEELFLLARCESIEIAGTNLPVLPGKVGSLKCLTRLDLHGNVTAEIEMGLGGATDLTEVFLQDNRITALPADLSTLRRLHVLVAYGNQLTSLPEGWERSLALQNFAVGQNQLRELPQSLGRAPSLKWLQVQENRLSALPDSLADSGIESLNLARNRFTQVPEVIVRLGKLQELDLSQNQLSGDISRLSACTQLKKLTLGEVGLKQFPDFRGLPLRTLDVSGNKFGHWPGDPAALPPTLEELVLRNCGLDEIPPWVETLALSRLDLFGNNLLDQQVRAVTEKVRRNWEEKQRALRASGKASR